MDHKKPTVLITGGNRGLGLELCQRFGAVSISRNDGLDISQDQDQIAQMSLEYDVFVNNAYDGIYGVRNGDFAQTKLLSHVATAWKQQKKSGHIINIGGVAGIDALAPVLDYDLYAANKAALRYHSHQWSRAFRQNAVPFKTTLLSIDRLDTPLGRQSPDWNGNGHQLADVGDMITLCMSMPGSVCIEEITAWVNLDHKQ